MKEKDLNKIAKIEKAIKDKYGSEAIQNPKGSWTKDKEEKYLQDLKDFYTKSNKNEKIEEKEGFTIKDKSQKQKIPRICPICSSYSFSQYDDLYMIKYQCCFNCYIQYIEDREERWKSGWRPND